MQYKINKPFGIVISVLSALMLSGCGGQGVCDDAEVLKMVRKLYAQGVLGQFIEAPEGAFTPQEKSATLVSVDKQSNITKCSTLVRADYVVLAKMAQKATDKELRENAAKKGMATFEDFLVSYQVQPLASGQNYVTLLRGGN